MRCSFSTEMAQRRLAYGRTVPAPNRGLRRCGLWQREKQRKGGIGMPNITMIPATKSIHLKQPLGLKPRRKTAGYARVSTDKDEQFTSYPLRAIREERLTSPKKVYPARTRITLERMRPSRSFPSEKGLTTIVHACATADFINGCAL